MTTNDALIRVTGNGRLRGVGNLLQREFGKWWRTRRWWTQALLWMAIVNGLLAATLFILPHLTGPEGQPIIADDPLKMGQEIFVGVSSMALAVGIIVMMQGVIIDEKQSGTAEWILSKPVSGTAFVIAKLVSNTVAMLVLMLLLPGLVGYALFWLYEPGAVLFANLLGALGVLALHTFFYLTLSLMMGVLANNRGAVLGVAFASLLGGGLVPVEALVRISPWQLAQVGIFALQGFPLLDLMVTMLGATAVWSVVFVLVAAMGFDRLEF